MGMILREPLASQIQQLAKAEGMSVEALMQAALNVYEARARKQILNGESEWFHSLPPNIRQRYAGQFVAVHNQVVVDYDHDQEALLMRINARFGRTPVFIAPAERRHELRLVSTPRIR